MSRFVALFAGLFLAFSLVSVDYAEARRGGSFGSRGTRTFQSAPPTRTAPQQSAPVERSMTPNTAPNAATRQPQAMNNAQRPGGFMNGFGGSLMRGLFIGGLIGLLMGQGLGGLAGFLGLLFQILLIGGLVFLVMRLLRGRQQPAPAMAGATSAGGRPGGLNRDMGNWTGRGQSMSGGGSGQRNAPAAPFVRDLELTQADLDLFERRLTEVQDAFGREDHGALRGLATPEMISFLSEELADNAKRGLRNDVTDIRLLQADIAESWREDSTDYATAALRYSARDVMVDRNSGQVVEGETEPTETVELWTFRRDRGSDWKLSAIQEA